MTPTERLRELLDERGEEYELTGWSNGAAVWWKDCGGVTWRAHDNDEDGLLSLYAYSSVTPEQAIAATLGRGECDRLRAENDKLRELVETQAFDLECMTANRDHLYADNDKLRELVKTAWNCVNRPMACYECCRKAGGCKLKSALRELGIEVDECK